MLWCIQGKGDRWERACASQKKNGQEMQIFQQHRNFSAAGAKLPHLQFMVFFLPSLAMQLETQQLQNILKSAQKCSESPEPHQHECDEKRKQHPEFFLKVSPFKPGNLLKIFRKNCNCQPITNNKAAKLFIFAKISFEASTLV